MQWCGSVKNKRYDDYNEHQTSNFCLISENIKQGQKNQGLAKAE